MKLPLPSWKKMLGKLGLQVVERRGRTPQRRRNFESLEGRNMMATLYWDTNGSTPGLGGAGAWDTTTANWTTDPTGSSSTQAWNNGAGDEAVFAGAAGTVTLGTNINTNSVAIQTTGYTVTGTNTLTFGGTGEVNVATSVAATLSSVVAGSVEFKKTGSGTLTVTKDNTGLTGGSRIEAGTLQVNHNGALGAGTIALAGGKLQSGNGARTLSNALVAATGTTSELVSPTNNNLTLNGNITGDGTIWKTGAYSVFLGGDNSGFSGTFSHRQSNLYFTTATAGSAVAIWDITGGGQLGLDFNSSGTVYFGAFSGTTGTVHGGTNRSGAKVVEIGALNTSTSYAGTIINFQTTNGGSTIALVKKGTGTLTLSGNSSFSGGASLEAGTLQVNHNNALGTGTITLAGGKLQSGNGARTLTNALVATTGTTSELISPSGNNLTLNGNLTGTGTINKSGAYSVFLGGDNSTFAGIFSNRQSNVFLNSPNSGSAMAAWDITGGDLLAMNFAGDGTVQLGSLAGTTGRVISGVTNGIKTVEVGALNQTTSYAGTIQNHTTTTTATVVNVVKKGSGSLTLSGANTFTGNMTIESGSLTFANNTNNGISDAGKGTITVGNAATLTVSGTNVFGTGANLPSEVVLETNSLLELTGPFYAQLPHVTLNGAAIASGAGNATYGSWAFMGGISAVGAATSTINGQNMYIPASAAIDVAAGATLAVTANFENTPGYGSSTLNVTGAGQFTRLGNLVINGSFEHPGVTAGTYDLLSSIPGWTLLRGNQFEIQDNISGLGSASEGSQHLELDSDTTSSDVQQIINVTPGNVYSVSFDYRGRPNRPVSDNQLKFQVLDSNGVVLREESISTTNTSSWTSKKYEFQAPTNAVRLVFMDTGTHNSYGIFVDNVQMKLVAEGDLDITNPAVEDSEEATTGGTIFVGQAGEVKVAALTKHTSTGDFKVSYDSAQVKLYSSNNGAAGTLIASGSIVTEDQVLYAIADHAGEALITLNFFAESGSEGAEIDRVKINIVPAKVWIEAADGSSEIEIREGETKNVFVVKRNYSTGDALPVQVDFSSVTGAALGTDYDPILDNSSSLNGTVWHGVIPANSDQVIIDLKALFDGIVDPDEDVIAELVEDSTKYEVGYDGEELYLESDGDGEAGFAYARIIDATVDLDIDSDNNGLLENSAAEDNIEESEAKIVAISTQNNKVYTPIDIQLNYASASTYLKLVGDSDKFKLWDRDPSTDPNAAEILFDTNYAASDSKFSLVANPSKRIYIEAVDLALEAETIQLLVDPTGENSSGSPGGYLLQDQVTLITSFVDIDIDSNNDGVIDPDNNTLTGTDDPNEMYHPGAIVQIDQNNFEEIRVSLGDLDAPYGSSTYDVKLEFSGSDSFKLWTDEQKTTEIHDGYIWSMSPGTSFSYFIEGIAEGTGVIKAYLVSDYVMVGLLDSVLFQVTDGPYIDLSIWNGNNPKDGPLKNSFGNTPDDRGSGFEEIRLETINNRQVRVGGAFTVANLNDTNGNGVIDSNINERDIKPISTAVTANNVVNNDKTVLVTVSSTLGFIPGMTIWYRLGATYIQAKIKSVSQNTLLLEEIKGAITPIAGFNSIITTGGEEEKDLMRINIANPNVPNLQGLLKLQVISGDIRVWKNSTKTGNPETPTNGFYDIAINTIPNTGGDLWIEVLTPSQAIGDIVLSLNYYKPGNNNLQQPDKFDIVQATGIWGSGAASYNVHNQTAAVTAITDLPIWMKDTILEFGGVGINPRAPSNDPNKKIVNFDNGIANKFTFTPTDLKYQPNVYFDGARSKEVYTEGKSNGVADPRLTTNIYFPRIPDQANDEQVIAIKKENGTTEILLDTEDSRGVTELNNFYIIDSPGVRLKYDDKTTSLVFYGNFTDWVMVDFSSIPGVNPFAQTKGHYGSRASSQIDWLVVHNIVADPGFNPAQPVSFAAPENVPFKRYAGTGNETEADYNQIGLGHGVILAH